MKSLFARFVREDAGQDLIEYGILIGLIGVAVIGAVKGIEPWVTARFTTLNTEIHKP